MQYFVVVFSKSLGRFTWGVGSTFETIKNHPIQLPIKSNGEINFSFMEKFIAELEAERIAELEAERIAELEAYLQATGLEDTTLTDAEQQALADFENENIVWKEFRIGDLFEIGTGSLLSSNELNDGEIPRISAKSENNGVLDYLDTDALSNARHFENFITVNFFGTDGGVFYHPYRASVEMKVHTLKIPNYEFNSHTGQFIATALKSPLNGFGYGNQLSSSKLKTLDFKIQLPIKCNGEIDYEFMERLISAVQKRVIEGVVHYTERKIVATKQVAHTKVTGEVNFS
ncbi:type I restriction modification DNA specificity domain protein [Elysia marginata]|uniref:Type I restriction modification DNA specificity domain protein n=1 Tax=Elysia marginata TaxID=1093978 RepID=A0AAV4F2Y0_9GAST|nr:type I restriction modification DNA specificity domain protein [Elysia marginata]